MAQLLMGARLLLLAVGFVITVGPFLIAIEMYGREQDRRRRREGLLRHAADYHDPYARYRRSQP